MFYESTKLDSGVQVVTERIAGARSVTVGFWVRIGNRDESPQEAGISHFMEHMLFKGTPTRSALDISMLGDSLGAELNAFTSRECTCFYSRVIDEHFDDVFELLADMVVNASFDQDAMDLERNVVLEEIAASLDTPEDHVYDVFSDTLMPTHPLGRPVLGNARTVSSFSHDDMRAFHDAHYTSGNLCVVACGNVEHEHVVSLVRRHLAALVPGAPLQRTPCSEPQRSFLGTVTRESEQAHLLYGVPSLPSGDERRYAAALFSTIMGGGMSSRLFAEIREKRGLAYSVYALSQGYSDAGSFCVYAGTRPENLEQVLGLVDALFADVVEHGVTAAELDRARELVCGSYVLAMESMRTHMSSLGKRAMLGLPFLSVDETLERYRAVSVEDVSKIASDLFSQRATVSIISPYTSDEIERMLPR